MTPSPKPTVAILSAGVSVTVTVVTPPLRAGQALDPHSKSDAVFLDSRFPWPILAGEMGGCEPDREARTAPCDGATAPKPPVVPI